MSYASQLLHRFMESATTAQAKNYVSELTPDEAVAIAILGGASWTIKDGKMTTELCGLYKRDGKWSVLTPASTPH